ncbi:MAG: hypothetical protein ACPG4S_05840, partial [Schleiferiaceae bacterium]
MAQSYPLFSFKTIDSTQSEIKRRLRDNGALEDFTTVVSDVQGSGRGRGVSVWQDEPGKCALMSIYVKWDRPVVQSFDVNRWVCHCLGAILPFRVQFKWPNDLMVGEGLMIASDEVIITFDASVGAIQDATVSISDFTPDAIN